MQMVYSAGQRNRNELLLMRRARSAVQGSNGFAHGATAEFGLAIRAARRKLSEEDAAPLSRT